MTFGILCKRSVSVKHFRSKPDPQLAFSVSDQLLVHQQQRHDHHHLLLAHCSASRQPFLPHCSKSGQGLLRAWWGSERARLVQVPLPAEGAGTLGYTSSVWPWANHRFPLALSLLFVQWAVSALDSFWFNRGCCGFLIVSIKRAVTGLRLLGNRNVCFWQNTFL